MPYLVLLFLTLCLALVVVPAVLSLRRNKQVDLTGGWGVGTRYFLVLLRLVIGWHFLVEGVDKLKSATWSSEAYLREASGPLAPMFRNLAGDSLAARLTPGPNNQFPEALADDWSSFFARFKAYYSLDAEQTKMADLVFRQSQSKTLTWMTTETKLIAQPLPQGPPLMVPMTVPERLLDLQKKEEQVRDIEENLRPMVGEKIFPLLIEVKKNARKQRAELRFELNKQTADMKNALAEVLRSDDKMPRAIGGGVGTTVAVGLAESLSAEQKNLPPMPDTVTKPVQSWTMLEWSDHIVKYGLVLVGSLLLLGLLTRTACVTGALFLLLFFLAMPPFPNWPENPRAEGHYLYINKNIIEMVALLTLATTRSGRWAGLDGLVQFLNPKRYSKQSIPENRSPVADASGAPLVDVARQSSFVSPEKSHGP